MGSSLPWRKSSHKSPVKLTLYSSSCKLLICHKRILLKNHKEIPFQRAPLSNGDFLTQTITSFSKSLPKVAPNTTCRTGESNPLDPGSNLTSPAKPLHQGTEFINHRRYSSFCDASHNLNQLSGCNKHAGQQDQLLVGGWTNPFEKYATVKLGSSFSQIGMNINKKYELPPPRIDITLPTLPETNSSHLKIGHPKRKLVFQPSIFRCFCC